jgi:ribosomal protein S18 acetylase RimI-like enzyme
MAWVLRDPATRLDGLRIGFAGLVRSFVTNDESELHIVGDACVTMWRSPRCVAPTPRQTPPEESPYDAEVAERFRILGELIETTHPHDRPHWYLNVIATLPARRGHGLGAQALATTLERIDAAGEHAYLESSNPRNMSLYRRQGFEELDVTIDLPEGPSLYPMWREARAR